MSNSQEPDTIKNHRWVEFVEACIKVDVIYRLSYILVVTFHHMNQFLENPTLDGIML